MRALAKRLIIGALVTGLMVLSQAGVFPAAAAGSVSVVGALSSAVSEPQDTTVYHVRGVDTIRIEILRDSSLIYRKSPASAWSIRNNIFYDLSGTPNLGFEVPVSGHVTLGGNVGFKHWDRFFPWQKSSDYTTGGPAAGTLHGYTSDSKWRNLVIAPEIRYYTDTINQGLFLGADLLYTHYNTASVKFPLGLYKNVRGQRVQGDFYGVGLFAGWSWWLDRKQHWRLEAEAGAALGWYDHRVFECAHCGKELTPARGLAAVPKLGLNLAYTFGERKAPVDSTVWYPVAVDTVAPMPYIPKVDIVVPHRSVAEILAEENLVLRPAEEYAPYTPEIILRKMGGPLYVHFELDKSVIKRDFRENYKVLDKTIDITRQIMADTASSVTRIQIVGFASFEGTVAHNQKLSADRADALKRYIQDRLTVGDSLFDLYAGGEAWSEFRDQVVDIQSGDIQSNLTSSQTARVLEIIDTEADPTRRERRIRQMDRGTVYQALKNDLLSDQRNSGYIRIYYEAVPDAAAIAVNQSIALMREGRHAEALAVLEPYAADPRTAIALSSALYYNGRTEEAVKLLEAAAAAGGSLAETAADNLRQLRKVLENNARIGQPIYPNIREQ